MKEIIDILFPMYANYRDNKKLEENSKNKDSGELLSCIENAGAIHIDVIKEQYDDTFYIKDKLEDKAKINIIGITVAITLIMNASDVLNTIFKRFPTPLIQWSAFVLLTAAVFYLLTAGIIVIKVLINENKVWYIPSGSFALNKKALCLKYAECIKCNQKQNLRRNNSIYSSYECIRNALVCLFVILLLSTIPIESHQNVSEQNVFYEQYSFTYLPETVPYVTGHNVQPFVEDAIINFLENDSLPNNLDDTICIIESKSNLFIKFKITEDGIKIMSVEPYLVP